VSREPHKACYGTMLPARVEGRAGETYRGKAMSLTIVTPPGLGPAARRVDVNPDEWDDCLACPEFDHCYKLCTARLILQTAGSV
jgi:hypothetical protein